MPCPQTFANLKSLFNNQNDSDCQIFFTKQNKKLFLQKSILKVNSDFFKACFESNMSESREGVVNIEEDDDGPMTELVKSFYTGQIEIPKTDDVASMIVLAQKYQIVAVVPTLLEALTENVNESNFLQCLMLDWENELFREVKEKVQNKFHMYLEEIWKGDAYLNLSIDQWLSALNLIVHKGNCVKAYNAVHDWVKVDEASRAQYSFALISAVRRSSDRIALTFQSAFCGSKATLSDSNRRIKKDSTTSWDCGALGTKYNHFSIRLLSNCTNLMVGMAPQGIKKEGNNYASCGWYLYCATGGLYSQSGDSNKAYAQKCCDNGTVIDVSLNDGCLSFSINGVDKGVAYMNLPDNLFPAFDIHNAQCEFEFC